MIIQDLEKKMKLCLFTVMATVIGCVIICSICLFQSTRMVTEASKQIYVLNGNIPILAERTKQEVKFDIEAKSHIERFHQYFFSLSPDDEYIKWSLKKAMYLVDESGMKQKNSMEEKGFYSNLMAASAVFTIMCDSIKLDMDKMEFRYFGTQKIERKTANKVRLLVTAGNLKLVPRTPNNPHGLLITNWRTLENRDIDNYQPIND